MFRHLEQLAPYSEHECKKVISTDSNLNTCETGWFQIQWKSRERGRDVSRKNCHKDHSNKDP